MARGSRAQLERFAQALAAGLSPADAAKESGYTGTSCAANAKKRAQRKDVKAMVAELRKPHLARVDEAISVSVEWATRHLKKVADKALPGDPSVADGLRAIDLTARLHGWVPGGEDGGDDRNPTVIKFQLNIFDSQRQERTIKPEPQAVLPKP
jgi:hypothetical protein